MLITIEQHTTAMEMHHIAVALQRIAAERGYKAPVQELTVGVDVTQQQAKAAVKVSDIVKVTIGEPIVTVSMKDVAPTTEETAAAYEFFNQVPDHVQKQMNDELAHADLAATVTDSNLDSAGLPWDARIHAGSRERNTDGSWRVRRRPKGVEEAEWDATLARVTAELRDLMEIPVSSGAALDAVAEGVLMGDVHATGHVDYAPETVITPPIILPPVVSPPGGYADGDSYRQPGVVHAVEVVATIEPLVIAPPVTAVTPPVTVASPPIETFAQLMSWLTSRTPKDEAAKPAMVVKVNEILAANGLTTLQQLGQRSELIPQVLVQFRAAFGE